MFQPIKRFLRRVFSPGKHARNIIVYVIEQHSGKLPVVVASAVTTAISASVAFIAGWATPHGANEVTMQSANGNLVSGH